MSGIYINLALFQLADNLPLHILYTPIDREYSNTPPLPYHYQTVCYGTSHYQTVGCHAALHDVRSNARSDGLRKFRMRAVGLFSSDLWRERTCYDYGMQIRRTNEERLGRGREKTFFFLLTAPARVP